MTLLTFDHKYLIHSATAISTTSDILVDDIQAKQDITLSASKTIFVFYSAHNIHNASEAETGKQIAINVDGIDYANACNSGNTNNANGVTTFWIGTLGAGSHSIKGRFASNVDGLSVTISERVLLICVFDGNEFWYIDNPTSQESLGTAFINDLYAKQIFTPSGICKASILYNVSNTYLVNESPNGKKTAINVDGIDYSQSEKSAAFGSYPDNIFTFHYAQLSPVSYTVQGRFASNTAQTTTVSRRQVGILLFSDTTLADYVVNDTQVTTLSPYPVDDAIVVDSVVTPQAKIERVTTDTRELLVISMCTKRYNTGSNTTGEAYGIKINTNDRTKSRNSPYLFSDANSASTAYSETLPSGSHIIQGRFGNNYGPETSAVIDSRRIVALWFPVVCPPVSCSFNLV